MTAAEKPRPGLAPRHRVPGQIFVHELLDLVASTDGSPAAVEDAITHLYDWHHARYVVGLQLSIAPAAAAVLAIVAKPASTPVLIIGGLLVLGTVLGGVSQLLSIIWLHREYVFALRLAMQIRPLRDDLLPYPHGISAPEGSKAHAAYADVGQISLVEYRKNPTTRESVLAKLATQLETS